MNKDTAVATLGTLGLVEPSAVVEEITDGSASLLHTALGSNVAVLRRGDRYDALVLGSEQECPVPSLRAFLESAVLPLSDEYAAQMGIAVPERDSVRKRIQEASVALDVLAKGRGSSVAPPSLSVQPQVQSHVNAGITSIDQLPEDALSPLNLNKLQTTVATWSREIDKLVKLSRNGPSNAMSIEEETVFWSSLDASLATAQKKLETDGVRLTLAILARKRRATGFLIEANRAIDASRRKSAGVLSLIQGLPLITLRTTEDLGSLRDSVANLLGHVVSKLRVSAIPVARVLSLIESIESDVSHCIGKVMSSKGALLAVPFPEFKELFRLCSHLFETWNQGFDNCRAAAREAAQKKGETMPPRSKSPLSHLQAHLCAVYALRSDYEDLREVFKELASASSTFKRSLEKLDVAYSWMSEECSTMDHYHMSSAGKSFWANIQAMYRSQIAPIESSARMAYEEAIRVEGSIPDLASALHPFRHILEKDFLSSAVAEAVPVLVKMGRKDLNILKKREASLQDSGATNETKFMQSCFSSFSQCILLRSRVVLLQTSMNSVIGKIHTDLSPELRDFQLEADQLQERVDPCLRFRKWMVLINKGVLNSNVLVISGLSEEHCALSCSLGHEEALFFKVLHITRSSTDFGNLLPVECDELARLSKSIYPAYCNIAESIVCYNSCVRKMEQLEANRCYRITNFLKSAKRKAREALESGLGVQWKEVPSKLSSYSASLLKKCETLTTSLQILLERDRAFERAIVDIENLVPEFSNGEVSVNTKDCLIGAMRKFNGGMDTFRQGFSSRDADAYITKHWIPDLQRSLTKVLQRITMVWIIKLDSQELRVPTICLDMSDSTSGELECTPSVLQIERFLYLSLGRAYSTIANAISACVVRVRSGDKDIIVDGRNVLSTYFAEPGIGQGEEYSAKKAFDKIHLVTSHVRRTCQSWSSYGVYLEPGFHDVTHQPGQAVERYASVLDKITEIYTSVSSLQKENSASLSRTGNYSSVRMDSSSLASRVSSNILSVLRLLSDRSVEFASKLSQDVYNDISQWKDTIQNTSSCEIMDILLRLQTIAEEVLPRCEKGTRTVAELEEKYSDIVSRTGDASFSRAQSAESWILSQELRAHLKELQGLYDQRLKSAMVNREMLLARLMENKSSFETKLSALFQEFQQIRSEKTRESDLFGSISALDRLEKSLNVLEEESRSLGRCKRGLGVSDTSEDGGPKSILDEVRKVKKGVEDLCCVEEKIALLSKAKIRDIDPKQIRDKLDSWKKEAEDIAKLSGAKREAGHLIERLCSHGSAHPILQGLQSTVLSPPRERDILRRLFGESFLEGTVMDVTLEMLWDIDYGAHAKYLRNVFENAAGEAAICDFLKSIERSWSGRKCLLVSRSGAKLLQGIPALLDEVDEHIQGLETLASSPHAKLFESERSSWEQKLATFREDLEVLADVQVRWAHLRTLFGSEDSSGVSSLRRELEEEFLSFSNVHARFATLGERMEKAAGLLESLEIPSGLGEMKKELDGIVRGLSSFLEGQRQRFPRFFFLSDNDLLNVLTLTSANIEMLLPHISKLFPGVSMFNFQKAADKTSISSLASKEGEVIHLQEPLTLSKNEPVTSWLNRLETGLTFVLKKALPLALSLMRNLYKNGHDDTKGFFTSYITFPSQVALLAAKIAFTTAVECSLLNSYGCGEGTKELLVTVDKLLRGICSFGLQFQTDSLCQNYVHAMRDQLIKELVHQKNVLDLLLKENISSASSHHWQHELRCYYDSTEGNSSANGDVLIRCGNSEVLYGWEYLGVGETLVHTHLTSRCFLRLCEALRRGFGGSPFGPAGTGKTETVKALGRIVGRFVAVFNCDESFDSVAVGRILAGACRVGSWVCFDEFNRLSANILSSTSGQLAVLQTAIRAGERDVSNFYGGDLPIQIRPGVGIFVTMNPTYTGRRDLPTNLKSLFRPCAMPKPDFLVIIQVLLLSQGFITSESLSKKLLSFFNHLRSTLPPQTHYDFGLRSLKSTVLAGGSLLSSEEKLNNITVDAHEENIMIRSLAEVLKPKLESTDIISYQCAIKSTFTKATCLTPILPLEFEMVLKEVMSEKKYVQDPIFMDKVRELYLLLRHRSGVMLVGPTGSLKTSVWRTLHAVLKRFSGNRPSTKNKLQSRSSLTVLDPKLLSLNQLYGDLNVITREWSDGLFTRALRSLSESSMRDDEQAEIGLHWIVFDGDVDPDWVENLNSVLDDNQILTLPTGEQLPLLSNTRILFETESLEHANPSTVSRCGLVRFGEPTSRSEMFAASIMSIAVKVLPNLQLSSIIQQLATITIETAKAVLASNQLIMQVPLESALISVTQLLRAALRDLINTSETLTESSNNTTNLSFTLFIRVFVCAVVKSVCSGLGKSQQLEVSKLFVQRIEKIAEIRGAMESVKLPSNLADVRVTEEGKYCTYSEQVTAQKSHVSSDDIGSPDVVISTPSTVRLEAFLCDYLDFANAAWNRVSPLILCGPPGGGKSLILSAALREIPNVSLATLSFSSGTSPAHILAALRGHTKISKRSNGSYCLHPKSTGYRVVLFCDEVNLQKPDDYDTQSSICFLRSLAEQGGFWNGDSPQWISIEGVQIVAACNPSLDSGRHEMSQRFLRHSCVVRVEVPDLHDLKVIYRVFIYSLLKGVHPELVSKTDAVTSAMTEYFIMNKELFSPETTGPLEPHYIYSPRDLTRWIRGLKQLLNLQNSRGLEENVGVDGTITTKHLFLDVVSAICYEARRVFCDRLLRPEERMQAEEMLLSVVSRHLDPGFANNSGQLYTSWLSTGEDDMMSQQFFKVVSSVQEFRTLVYQKLRVFAEEEGLGGSWMGGASEAPDDSSTMIDQFAVTDDVLTHLVRIERALSQPLGHIVLIGAPGTGKKTLARFAAWMLSIEVHQVYSHTSYTEQDFARDLRAILRKAGVDCRQVMMLFDESNAMDSAFLEMMNSILACGEVPGLYSGEDRSRLLEDLRTQGTANISSITTEQGLYAEFVKRVRNNLHIVFTISTGCSDVHIKNLKRPAGGDIAERSPALYNRCTVDWIGDWCKETLEAVAELKIEVALGQEKDQIIRCAVEIHEIAKERIRQYASSIEVTPRHYLEFIEQINRIALEKGNLIQEEAHRHTEGLRRLEAAGIAVDDLKDALSEKTDQLQQKEAHANATLSRMVEEQRRAEESKVAAEQLALAAQEASKRVQEQEAEVSGQLSEVQPKIQAAREAVGSIRKDYLEELRAMPNPPSGVRIALEGVLMLLEAKSRRTEPYTWAHIRSKMRGSDFIPSVVNFNTDSLTKGVLTRIETRILQNQDFDVNKIAYASSAAGPLAEWTLAVFDYAAVKEAVEPLQQEVHSLRAEQVDLLDKKESALEEVDLLQERIEECRKTYASLISEAERVRQEIQESETNLQRAEAILSSLDEEFRRWVKELNALNDAAVTMWGNAVHSAAYVAYAGVLDHISRSTLSNEWKEVLHRENVQFDAGKPLSVFLTSAEERGLWSAKGMPTDQTSIENYAILKRSARFPLLVNPSRHSTKMLQNILASTKTAEKSQPNESRVRIAESSFAATGKKSYMRSLESSLRFGTPIVLEDAEKFDRAVAPLLGQESTIGNISGADHTNSAAQNWQRRTVEKLKGNVYRRVVRLGDRDVFVSPSFRLYLSTTNLHAVPRAATSRCNVVSFEMSPAALQSSCVSRAMHILMPELEAKRRASLIASLKYEERKQKLEREVLSAITDVDDLGNEILRGSLLDNLSALKEESLELEMRQKEEVQASLEVEHAESVLAVLGDSAVDAFGTLQCLHLINSAYTFHAKLFMSIFSQAVREVSTKSDLGLEDKVAESQNVLLRKVYAAFAPSLFPKDRVPFASGLALVSKFCKSKGHGEEEMGRILIGARLSMRAVVSMLDTSRRMTESEKAVVCGYLPEQLRSKMTAAKQHDETEALSVIEHAICIISVATYAPEHILSRVDKLACILPGKRDLVHGREVESAIALHTTLSSFCNRQHQDDGNVESQFAPLFLLSRGENSDPATLTTEIATQLKLKVISITMGSSSEELSTAQTMSIASTKSRESGRVLILIKNLHLAGEKTVERLQVDIMRRNGLFPNLIVLTGEESPHLANAFAYMAPFCRLLAFESPPTFRENFRSALEVISAERKHKEVKWPYQPILLDKLHTVAAWMHAAILERALHAPVGFTKSYKFSLSDLLSAWDAIVSTASKAVEEATYLRTIAQLLIHVVYGSRIEDDMDFDTLVALISKTVSTERLLTSEESASVTLVERQDCSTQVDVPHQEGERNDFVRQMPTEAPPEWSYMPTAASKRMHITEGKEALHKLVHISRKKFSHNTDEESPAPPGDDKSQLNSSRIEESLTDGLNDISENLPDEFRLDESVLQSTPVACYLSSEEATLRQVTTLVRNDVQVLSCESTKKEHKAQRLLQLRTEVEQNIHSDSKTLPEAWFEICPFFGRRLSLSRFFCALKRTALHLQKLKTSVEEVDLSAVLRPEAVLETLRHEEARRMGLSPHELELQLMGESSPSHRCYLLKGVQSNRLIWDPSEKIFQQKSEQTDAGNSLWMSWSVTEQDCSMRHNQTLVYLPLYGRGFQGSAIMSVCIPVSKRSSLAVWRLHGASFSVDLC